MPGFLLHVNASMQCPHPPPVGPGQATITPSQLRVVVSGQPVATMASQIAIAGCLFQVGNKPQPCVTVKWTMPSTRFLVGGQPVALLPALGTAPAICQSAEQIPQGPPLVSVVQSRVIGS
ncbi:MAG TPA: hypothetical protein VFU37_15975 [Pyrinomonadaceae bacterium]|nr:hypothetical protein [Pyrinomonadaceae bacterium]